MNPYTVYPLKNAVFDSTIYCNLLQTSGSQSSFFLFLPLVSGCPAFERPAECLFSWRWKRWQVFLWEPQICDRTTL